MTSLRLLFLGPLSILCFQIMAQVDDLMRDKNISWIAESYNDFLTDEIAVEKLDKRISSATLLKFLNPTEEDVPENFTLQYHVLKAAKAGDMIVFEDANCTKPTTYEIATARGDEEENKKLSAAHRFVCTLYTRLFTPDEFLFFRTRQILYYDSKKIQFGLRTIAIAPMMKITDEEGKLINWKALFWIKATDLTEKHSLLDNKILWAKQMDFRNGVILEADGIKILKQVSDSLPIKPLFQAFLTKPNISFYKPDPLPSWMKYTFIEKQKFFIRRDTACSGIEPDSNTTELRVINRDIRPADVVGLRLIQNWYWNDKKKRLEIYLVATAPLVDVKNEAGEFLYKRSLFYRRTDD